MKVNKRDDVTINPEEKRSVECPRCQSNNAIKRGKCETPTGLKQKWRCKECGKGYRMDTYLYKMKTHPLIITISLKLYLMGMSYRDIQNHLKEFYKVNISHVTVMRWVKKYSTSSNFDVKFIEDDYVPWIQILIKTKQVECKKCGFKLEIRKDSEEYTCPKCNIKFVLAGKEKEVILGNDTATLSQYEKKRQYAIDRKNPDSEVYGGLGKATKEVREKRRIKENERSKKRYDEQYPEMTNEEKRKRWPQKYGKYTCKWKPKLTIPPEE